MRITIQDTSQLGLLAGLAESLGFDHVHYADRAYIYLSVIPDECRAKVDLLFLLDGSSSMKESGYNLEREFVKEVLKYFNVAPDESRVASISYASSTRPDFTFDKHATKASLSAAIDRLVYSTGDVDISARRFPGNNNYCITRRGACGTKTRDAISQATQFFGSTAYGARPKNASVTRVVAVLTDGTCVADSGSALVWTASQPRPTCRYLKRGCSTNRIRYLSVCHQSSLRANAPTNTRHPY